MMADAAVTDMDISVQSIESINKKKAVVTLEDGSSFPMYMGEIRRYGITEGESIETSVYREIMSEILIKRARERAMYILKGADKTEKQLRDKLAAGRYPAPVIDSVIEFLKKYDYINDYDYAMNYIRIYSQTQSIRMIKLKLSGRGIDRDTLEEAVEEYAEQFGYNSEQLIMDIIRKKHFDCSKPDLREKNRMISHLLRKGFKYDEIIECIKKINKKDWHEY